jgi:hypothetical protein
MTKFRGLLLLILGIIIGVTLVKFTQSLNIIPSKITSTPIPTQENIDIPECNFGLCPRYLSEPWVINGEDVSVVIVPTAMTKGAGQLWIIQKGKVVYKSPELPEISAAYNGNSLNIKHVSEWKADGLWPKTWETDELVYTDGTFKLVNPLLSPTPKSIQINNSNLKTAIKIAKEKGYDVFSTNEDEDNFSTFDFNVLIGTCTGSADGYCQSALFFNKDKFIGMDSDVQSNKVSMAWRNDKTIALNYSLYKDSDGSCCPTGGSKIVRFVTNGSKVTPLDAIPPYQGSLYR